MEHRQFGRSGLRVTALSLGAMTFGEAKGFMKGVHSDDAEARRVFDAASVTVTVLLAPAAMVALQISTRAVVLLTLLMVTRDE